MASVGKTFWLGVRRSLGLGTPPVVLAYRGYGTRREAYLQGHVLDDRLLRESSPRDSWWQNVRAMLSRFLSVTIPDAVVRIRLFDQEVTTTTDEDGCFSVQITFPEQVTPGWYTAFYSVENPLNEGPDELVTQEEVLIVSSDVNYGIISDVDDTIIISHASQTLQKLRLILTKNASTRLPFPGVAALYQQFQDNSVEGAPNPFFFISSSEWNLYDFLVEFCAIQNIPKGVFLLDNLKKGLLDVVRSGGGTHNHKLEKARSLLNLYPDLSFVLFGDSGQRDADLYASLSREFPDRILAIYIRQVSNGPTRENVMQHFQDIPLSMDRICLTAKTEEVAQHAGKLGLLNEQAVRLVREAVEGD